jgi:sugar/nucleoside kinase (ribokinase family)
MVFLSLGEALVDLIADPATGITAGSELRVQPGGAPFNVAIVLSKLGTECTFLGALSEDDFGAMLAQVLGEHGVRLATRERVPAATRLAVVNHRAGSNAFRFYGHRPADTWLTEETIGEGLRPPVTGIYVGSLMMADTQAAERQRQAVELAVAQGITIFADPNPRPALWPQTEAMQEATEWLLRHASVAKVSLDDAANLGWPIDPEALLRFLTERWPATILLTGGAAGCWTMADGHAIHQPAYSIDPIDPTGAGDASFAALIGWLLSGNMFDRQALRRVAAAGALAASKPGAVAGLPSAAELEAFLARPG